MLVSICYNQIQHRVADCSVDRCLTSSEGSQKEQERDDAKLRLITHEEINVPDLPKPKKKKMERDKTADKSLGHLSSRRPTAQQENRKQSDEKDSDFHILQQN
ncbi:hypothetical protein B296_00045648 [Ensete ventricosum]|uniref:Uncharacterized protein n=1 Tax=Ensete ventricosum TaxID=4639 RepID=A0A426XBZ5_ENSVE|nr:hypothetical protein B296_00045648 [Ensete ventricosum]